MPTKILRSLLVMIAVLMSSRLTAQTYPFYDDFESYTAFQVPSAYPGNIQVRLVHGTNNSQGLGSFMNTFVTKDSATSPLIGPLTATSGLSFDWRIVATIGSAFVPANLVAGDHFDVSVSIDGINYQDVLIIDHLNYVPSTDFYHFSMDIGAFSGNNLNVKFNIRRLNNPDDYYVDIDNLSVSDTSFSTGLPHLSQEAGFCLYPNPAHQHIRLVGYSGDLALARIRVLDIAGKEVLLVSESNQQLLDLDLSSLASGYYTCIVEDGIKRKSLPFIKD